MTDGIVSSTLVWDFARAIKAGLLDPEQIGVIDDAIETWEREHGRERHGTVARWRQGEAYGFVEDDDETTWFVSRVDEPRPPADLTEGNAVVFTGSPRPKPGKRHPTATGVRRDSRPGARQ